MLKMDGCDKGSLQVDSTYRGGDCLIKDLRCHNIHSTRE